MSSFVIRNVAGRGWYISTGKGVDRYLWKDFTLNDTTGVYKLPKRKNGTYDGSLALGYYSTKEEAEKYLDYYLETTGQKIEIRYFCNGSDVTNTLSEQSKKSLRSL